MPYPIFEGCYSLPVIDNVCYADNYVVEAIDKNLTTYTLKEGTRYLGTNCFNSCPFLESITIPESVIYIGNNAFNYCYRIKELTIPNSVKFIGSKAFSSTHIRRITIPEGITNLNNCFYYCRYLEEVNIPNTVTSIAANAFWYCDSLLNINIPESVSYIGYSAFENSGITSLTLPKNLTTVSSWLCRNCKNLEKVVIPDNVTVIEKEAFADCPLKEINFPANLTRIEKNVIAGIKDIVIPATVTYLGEHALGYGFETITCLAETPPQCENEHVFWGYMPVPEIHGTLIVPEGTASIYRQTFGWQQFRENKEIPKDSSGLNKVSNDQSDSHARKYIQDGKVIIKRGADKFTTDGNSVR